MPPRRAPILATLTTRLVALGLTCGLTLGLAAPVGAAATPRRVVLLSCDGAGAHTLARAVAGGRMPRLAAILAAGASASQMRTSFPANTAAGHASLWTGAFGDVNGVSGNRVPVAPLAAHSILETANGFLADALSAEPLYVTAARAGKRVLAVDVPQTTPLEAFGPGGKFGDGVGDRLAVMSGLLGRVADDGVVDEASGIGAADAWTGLPRTDVPARELVVDVGAPLYLALIGDPADPMPGYDTVLLAWNRDGRAPVARLKPRAVRDDAAWSAPVRVPAKRGAGLAFFRLFDLDPQGRRLMLYHTAPTRVLANGAAAPVIGSVAPNGVVIGGGVAPYRAGRFGRTLAQGGDGRAEERYLATVRFAFARQRQTLAALVDRSDWDLLLAHVPFPDEAAHLWFGYVTPGSPAYDRGLAPRLGPALEGVYTALDGFLGDIHAALAKDTALVVVGDHGMAPARWDFKPNVALRRAGLLTLDGAGRPDLARTRVLYGPADGAYLVVNSTDRPGGIVPPAAVPAALAEARRALGAITVKTPAGVVPLVRSWLEPSGDAASALGVGGRAGGQLYFDVQPGYDLSSALGGEALFDTRPTNASGIHDLDARRPGLHAAFYAVGAGIKRGARVSTIRTIDVAPTVSKLLGIRPPADATGRVLDDLLAP